MKKLLTKSKLVEDAPNPSPLPDTPTTNILIGKSCKLQTHTVTIEDVIAEGGFGVVFLARNGKSTYALKRIVVNNEADKEVAEREISIMSMLTTSTPTPHLLPLLDHQTIRTQPDITEIYSLTPYCRGSLLQHINKAVAAKTPLAQAQCLRIFLDIVQGVSCMHSLNIIHRDLKVENVLEKDGVFLLCDFGSASLRVLDPDVHGALLIAEELEKYTTLAYRAPEMVDLYSGRGSIGLKSDVWALGVLFYKTLFWTTPFGDSILAIQSAKKLDFPSSSYSTNLLLLISYMLTPDQSHRPDIHQVNYLLHNLMELPSPTLDLKPKTFQEIAEYLSKANEGGEVKKVVSQVVVLETSVTPRQRPKAGQQVQQAVLMPPPKSPKVERKSPSGWNPFETETVEESGEGGDEVFANAPFGFV